jgi:hypothetical protein
VVFFGFHSILVRQPHTLFHIQTWIVSLDHRHLNFSLSLFHRRLRRSCRENPTGVLKDVQKVLLLRALQVTATLNYGDQNEASQDMSFESRVSAD